MFLRKKKDPKAYDDTELAERYARTGDMEWLGILFNRYMHLIYGVCLKYLRDREESKDATMQIFEKLTQSLKHEKVNDFNRWIYIVTRNYCLMALRKRKSMMAKEIDLAFMETDYVLHHNDTDIMESDMLILKKCLEALPEHQRKCVELFYFNEKCYKEIAEEIHVETGKVKSYIQNGKRNLKTCIERAS